MSDTFLSLPIAIQIVLGSGYLAYTISYAGLRQHHTATDAAFLSIAFGLGATAAMVWLPPDLIWKPVAAVAASIALGIIWRWRGARLVRWLLRHTDLSWTDDVPSAWLSITAERTDIRFSQIAVDLEGGRVLLCENTTDFADAPFGPCILGLNGDLAFYVTAERCPDGTWTQPEDIVHPSEGHRLTYIPASSVKRVEFRCWTAANGKAAQVAELGQAEAEATSAA